MRAGRVSFPGSALARICLFASLLCSVVVGCSRKYCKEAGCLGWLKVHYTQPITGPYELSVATRGLSLAAQCPQARRDAPSTGEHGAILGCSAADFEILVPASLEGVPRPYGDHAVDADPIAFDVTLTPLAPGATSVRGRTEVRITRVQRPNGPECPSVCYSREGRFVSKP